MKYCKALFISLAIMTFISQVVVADTIKMGFFMLPPLQYTEDAATPPKGALISYFNALASKTGHDVKWVGPLPLLRLSKQLETGELDGTVGFNKNSRLTTFLYYLDTPVYLAQPSFIVRKDNSLTQIRSIDDIRGYRIGLNVSITGVYTPLIDEHRDVLTLDALGGEQWLKQNLMKLIAGRVEAVFDLQPYSMLFVATRRHMDGQIKVLTAPDTPTPMYVVFSKASKRGQELLKQYNVVAPQLDLNFDELVQKELDATTKQP